VITRGGKKKVENKKVQTRRGVSEGTKAKPEVGKTKTMCQRGGGREEDRTAEILRD